MVNGSIIQVHIDDVCIFRRVRVASSWFARLRGLLGVELKESMGLWLLPCSSIHMFGMRYPIDALFLDKDNKVCKLAHNVLPYRFAFGGSDAYSVIEVQANTLHSHAINIGDQIKIIKEE